VRKSRLGYNLTTFEMSLDQILGLTEDQILEAGKCTDSFQVVFNLPQHIPREA